MAKKKSVTKDKDDAKSSVPDVVEELQPSTASDDTPIDAEAAYWEQKVKKSAKSIGIDTITRQVEDYVSNIMVVAKPNESSEQLLRRFNREVRDLNLMDEIRERLEYEKPSQRRKRLKREKYLASKKRYWE